MNTIQVTDKQLSQIILAIDIVENTTEGLTMSDLDRLGIELDKAELFALASSFEAMLKKGAN